MRIECIFQLLFCSNVRNGSASSFLAEFRCLLPTRCALTSPPSLHQSASGRSLRPSTATKSEVPRTSASPCPPLIQLFPVEGVRHFLSPYCGHLLTAARTRFALFFPFPLAASRRSDEVTPRTSGPLHRTVPACLESRLSPSFPLPPSRRILS